MPSSHLLGNLLTSISSLQTLPPSPRFVAPSSQPHNGRPSPRSPPNTRDDLPIPQPSPHLSAHAREGCGSVPSPRPRTPHLNVASAPSRPRMLRVPSTPTVHVSSPLNPACRNKVENDSIEPSHFLTGSVPQPRPPRLFCSMLNSSEPDLQQTRRVPVLADANADSAPAPLLHRPRAPSRARPILVPDMALLTHHTIPQTAPVPMIAPSPKDPSGDGSVEAEGEGRAPSSFSEFVQSVLAPRCVPDCTRRWTTLTSSRHDRLLPLDEGERSSGHAQGSGTASAQMDLSRSPDLARKLAWVN